MIVPMGNNSAKKYSYYYDREGRQVGMDVEAVSVTSSPTLTAGSSGSNTRFFYDNSRNRVKLITKSGSAYYFVYDPTASIPAVVYEAAGTTAYLNTREPSGALISRETYVSGVYQYSRTYHFDGLGSAIALTDEDGVTTDTYSYDAWGNVTPGVSNQTTDNPYQYVGELGYYTHWQEPTLKLLQLGVRYYDPSVGRFTQIDPIKDGINWYGYVDGNPIGWVDPSGTTRECELECYSKVGLKYDTNMELVAKFYSDVKAQEYVTRTFDNMAPWSSMNINKTYDPNNGTYSIFSDPGVTGDYYTPINDPHSPIHKISSQPFYEIKDDKNNIFSNLPPWASMPCPGGGHNINDIERARVFTEVVCNTFCHEREQRGRSNFKLEDFGPWYSKYYANYEYTKPYRGLPSRIKTY